MDHDLLRKELSAVGISCIVIENDIPKVSESTQALADLIVAAHGKLSEDSSVVSLRGELSSDPVKWAAYIEIRNNWTREKRESLFKSTTDRLRFKADDYEVGSEEWLTAISQWRSAKTQIRSDFPYLE